MKHSDLVVEPGNATTSSRRRFLMTSAGVGAVSLFTAPAFAAPGADSSPVFELSGLPSEAEVWKDVVYMNDLGPRYPGNPAHQRFTDFLENGLANAGLQVENIPHSSLVLWEPVAWGLRTSDGKEIAVASFCRWSALTGPSGITAPVKFCGRAEGVSVFTVAIWPDRRAVIDIPVDIQGKIALIEVVAEAWPFDAMFHGHVSEVADPTHAGPLPPVQATIPIYQTPLLPGERSPYQPAKDHSALSGGGAAGKSALTAPGFEEALRKAGAVGVIYSWVNGTDADVRGQRKDGTEVLPSLWVGGTASKQLRALADRGESVTMTVDAKITRNAPTRTTVATLPGQSQDEVIVLWTHTDGNNALGNGSVAILHLMKYFAGLPLSIRKRTIVCVMSEGHFAEQYVPTSSWLKERPDLVQKAVTVLGLHHAGCREWVADPAKNSFRATGKPEFSWVFCQSGPFVPGQPDYRVGLMQDALKQSRKARTVVVDSSELGFARALEAYRIAKIPTIAYISTPPYIFAEAPNGHIDKIHSGQLHDEMKTLARTIHLLDAAPKHLLRSV